MNKGYNQVLFVAPQCDWRLCLFWFGFYVLLLFFV